MLHSVRRNVLSAIVTLIVLIVMGLSLLVPASATTNMATGTIAPSATFSDHVWTYSPDMLTELGPLPTFTSLPSASPTLGRMVTVTSASPQHCPSDNGKQDFNLDLAAPAEYILDYLNQDGGLAAMEKHIGAMIGVYSQTGGSKIHRRDVTGDSVPDLIMDINPPMMVGYLFIFTCRDGQYITVYEREFHDEGGSANIEAIQDLNGNGLPEIIYMYQPIAGTHGYGTRYIMLLEWNGQGFTLLANPEAERIGFEGIGTEGARITIRPHSNGTSELVFFTPAIQDSYYGGSITGRPYEHVWIWNGVAFTYFCSRSTEPPTYRVHAVEDGDKESLCGNYDKAMTFYQQAIFSDALLNWTEATTFTPADFTPVIDPDERTYLNAYSRYRIILLHVLRKRLKEAETDYNILQQKYPIGHTGHQFAQLAEKFWTTYSNSGSIAAGCQSAAEFAAVSAEVILPLQRYAYCSDSLCEYPFPIRTPGDTYPLRDATALCPFRQ